MKAHIRGATTSVVARAPVVAIAVIAVCSLFARPDAQILRTGQTVTPVYEGWETNADGSFSLVFGYLNRNWDEEFHLSIGPENSIAPGGPDRGQPTYFFPRRNRFVFRIRVPKDFGNKELVWSLTSRGKTERAYATLKPDYILDDIVVMSNTGAGGALSITPDMVGNKPPSLVVEGEKSRSAQVGDAITLVAVATDDGKPNPRRMPQVLGGNYILPNSANGLRLSWFAYRGSSRHITFDPLQAKVWEDTRDGGNSPWSAGWTNPPIPPENKWVVKATFSEPGSYVVRCLAHDGGLSTFEDVSVVVTR